MFTAAALLPAAVMGLDLFQLLRGAAAMSERFQNAPPGDNPVLDDAAAGLSFAMSRGAAMGSELVVWEKALFAMRRWHDQFNREQGTTRTIYAPGATGPELITNLVVDEPRRDRLTAETTSDRLTPRDSAGCSYAERMAAKVRARRTTNGWPPALRSPRFIFRISMNALSDNFFK